VVKICPNHCLKKVAVITATRAEYGLLSGLIQSLHQHPSFELQLLVTGAHLVADQGKSVTEIRQAGIPITAEIPIALPDYLQAEDVMAQITAQAVAQFSQAFLHYRPDLVVILGDRYEILGVATAALLNQIPIAHLHGGELTQGAVDDAIRHAITKMSSLHFVAADVYRKRVLQMGEAPERVFNVGAMGLDKIRQLDFLTQDALEQTMGLSLTSPTLLITHHPETWHRLSAQQGLQALFRAIEHLAESQGKVTIIWTAANLDAEGAKINQMVQQQLRGWENSPAYANICAKFVPSLGSQRYLSLMKLADLVVGNSSSGIIEAPALQTATVNIGERQAGRLMAKSIFQAKPEVNSILQAMEKGLNYRFIGDESLYGDGASVQTIMHILEEQDFKQLLPKPFVDL